MEGVVGNVVITCRYQHSTPGESMICYNITRLEDTRGTITIEDKRASYMSIQSRKYQTQVVNSHIQRIGCQPGNNYFTRWPIPLVVC